jgi:hypothetical protein
VIAFSGGNRWENTSASGTELEFARIWKDTPKIVFSKTLEHVETRTFGSRVIYLRYRRV